MDHRNRRLLYILSSFFSLVSIGTVGYMLLEQLNPLEALYMTIITISTVGFQEVTSLTVSGRILTMFIILAGLGTVAYTFTSISSYVLEGEFNKQLRRRRMENKVSNLRDHYIICGSGKTGTVVISQFLERKVPFIVIEVDEERVRLLEEQGILCLQGSASDEELLEKARIKSAKGLIVCLANDADSVFTVLTARQMNAKLYIVSRAFDPNAHRKLLHAGANNTISPDELGGTRLAALVLKPAVVSFIDIITRFGELNFDLEEVDVATGSNFVGKNLKQTGIREKTGLIVMAIKRQGMESLIFNPDNKELLREGDKMIVLGNTEQIEALRTLSEV